jgi:hypothetical protein
MLTIFFTGTKLISLNALPDGGRFTQDYFMNTILPDIIHERGQILRRVRRHDFFDADGQFHVPQLSPSNR